jgi:hypothetical protein
MLISVFIADKRRFVSTLWDVGLVAKILQIPRIAAGTDCRLHGRCHTTVHELSVNMMEF